MLKSYFTIAVRSLWRQKGYAALNLSGLAVGFACALLVWMYVANEISYDGQYDGDQVYRVVRNMENERGMRFTARSVVPMGPALAAEYPEVGSVARFWRGFQPTLGTDEQTREEPGLYFADATAFDVFPLEFRSGLPTSALSAPGSIVLTESTAREYFGDDDPMGRTLTYNGFPGENGAEYTVTGVLADLPENTHLKFTALASLVGVETESESWGSNKPIWTYVRLANNTEAAALEAKLPAFVDRYMGPAVGRTVEQTMILQPVRDIHFSSRYTQGFKPGNSRSLLNLFVATGIFILLLACVNFINLSTARSMQRAREIGMRKVLGAARSQLVRQFLGEAIVMAVLAGALGVFAVELALPAFNALFGKSLMMRFGDAPIFLGVPTLAIATGLLAGFYPALLLSRFQPAAALAASRDPGRVGVRRGLVVFQFAISVALLIGTVAVKQQLDYASALDLGITQEQVLVVPYSANAETIIQTVSQNPRIRAASVSQRVPVSTINGDTRPVLPEGFEQSLSTESYIVDDQFADAYGLQLAAGRFLSLDRADAAGAFVINESAVSGFGWASPADAIGKEIVFQNGPITGPVVGVVRDFNLASIHETIPPLVMQLRPESRFWQTWISFRISPENVAETLALVEQTWRAQTPDGAYRHFFIDESFQALHEADARFGRIVSTFSFIALFIACLGLFGLAAFTTERRAKEVGIRKTLGATIPSIVGQLSREYAGLVVVAFAFGAPLAYVFMSRWLERFAYRIDFSVSIFAIAGGVTMLMALMAVGYHSLRAATTNPVESLQSE